MFKSLKMKITLALFTLFLLILSYLFLFGKLFPFSPIILGFTKHELTNSIIYVQNESEFTDLQRIDKLLKPVEASHRLNFTKKPRILIFSDRSTYSNRTTTNARFCVYPNGTLVVSPWAIDEDKSGLISLDIYITHELSHVLLYQHMDILTIFKYPQWLMEGIAVYISRQLGTSWYPSKGETYNDIKNGYFFPPHYYKTDQEYDVKLDIENPIAFMYSEFACIVDNLIEIYGTDMFFKYMDKLLDNADHDKVFIETFNKNYSDFLVDFKEYVNKY